MKSDSQVDWMEGLQFKALIDGTTMIVEGGNTEAIERKGPRPKPLLLTALAGCTAMDVISILKKMQESVRSFSVNVSGDTAEEHPMKFLKLTIEYILEGQNLSEEKVKKAVNLSIERYCGVYATLIQAVPIETVIKINGKVLEN